MNLQSTHIADLHCDLLCYLSRDPKRSPYDPAPRCSIPQLREGNVKLQTLAIFTETLPGSSKSGQAQVDAFKHLLKHHSDVFERARLTEQESAHSPSTKIGIMPAIENASSLCEEEESLEEALARCTTMQRQIGRFAYVSLTWNTENRFGGGALTQIGLKEDGKRLLDYLSQHQIALDLSHASDYLAVEAINYIDKNRLQLPLLASHSNFRSVCNVPRNLPDDLAKEILQRNGLIGLNFVRPFVGESSPHHFVKQLEHALQFGYPSNICFGADFFYTGDVSSTHRKSPEQLFFDSFDHAGTYANVLTLWQKHLALTPETLSNICYHNLVRFFGR